jgi:hypothetical protein
MRVVRMAVVDKVHVSSGRRGGRSETLIGVMGAGVPWTAGIRTNIRGRHDRRFVVAPPEGRRGRRGRVRLAEILFFAPTLGSHGMPLLLGSRARISQTATAKRTTSEETRHEGRHVADALHNSFLPVGPFLHSGLCVALQLEQRRTPTGRLPALRPPGPY